MFGQSRPTPSYGDAVRHGQLETDTIGDAALVPLDIVSARFVTAGLPRSMRTLQRYCANGTLDCVKEATDTGDTYFVSEASIEPAITSLRQLHEAKTQLRQTPTERAVSISDAPASKPYAKDDAVGHGPSGPDTDAHAMQDRQTPTQPDTSAYVAQLEDRLSEKDEEIAFLREELIDRRGQIKDMKGIIDGQNQLLEVIQRNVAPIFKSLASTVEQGRITIRDDEQGSDHDLRAEHEPADTRGLM